jgi:hypothetical protein
MGCREHNAQKHPGCSRKLAFTEVVRAMLKLSSNICSNRYVCVEVVAGSSVKIQTFYSSRTGPIRCEHNVQQHVVGHARHVSLDAILFLLFLFRKYQSVK